MAGHFPAGSHRSTGGRVSFVWPGVRGWLFVAPHRVEGASPTDPASPIGGAIWKHCPVLCLCWPPASVRACVRREECVSQASIPALTGLGTADGILGSGRDVSLRWCLVRSATAPV